MASYKVVRAFTDNETEKGYNEGSTFTSDDEERVSFLADNGFIKITTSHKVTPKRAPRKKESD
ncbi:hypothetical protein [Lysinibacillus fusiformis]|uniref:Uncharacterized protein n=1 Tax=Lysinibacillus fusiformis TaxID=28031 RepID=A0A1H9HBT3_9BACI|nr:hypothetical protein [Lysinibacillus fusiformis]SCY30482.1 hypothetical protein SAMN02787081_01966 [Lysinibacillus fusiformis]SEN53189.1 hypothetical protein SAMN02787103_02055 [Lysinibacillus fusiformis]SEQ59799.1 hypothetical protein SAMN02787113_01979 [Lysinibacillus fusiformis]